MDVSMEETTSALSQNGAQWQLPPPVPSSSTQTYRYSPLKHEHDIRLLYLLPGSNEAPLSCSLRIVSLSEIPDYEAVSYTWGEPIFSASIECSSKGHLPITENLSKALFHLRLANRSRVLWIDAICINQQDPVERSHQVTLLRNTFQRAKNVVVWLGEDTGDAKKAFEILRAVDPSSSSKEDICSLISADRHNALANLLGRSWFRRIWVVQELVCAKNAIITCGNHEMEWEKFLDVAGTIQAVGNFESIIDRSVYDALFVLCGIRSRRRIPIQYQREETDLKMLLYSYRCCLASDPRDKVFALVGIARGQIALAYTPDYSKSVLEVYRDLAMHFIITEQNPDLLVHCAYIVGSTSPLIPSWVPDWSQDLDFNCSPMVCPYAYEASAGTSFRGRVSGNLDELFLDGVLVNKVDTIGGAWYIGERDEKRMIEINEVYIDMFRQSPRYGACYWSAFTRALVADRDHYGDRLGQLDLGEVYVAYRKLLSQGLVGQITSRLSFPLMDSSTEPPASAFFQPELASFQRALHSAGFGRAFCMFDDGRAGWVPLAAEVGDQIAIFLGATVPILLRPRGNGYIVLGEAYVDEMMDGQAFEGPDVQIETITLV